MAKITVVLDIEDIKTNRIGKNFMVTTTNDISLIFTPEAMEEIIVDFALFKVDVDTPPPPPVPPKGRIIKEGCPPRNSTKINNNEMKFRKKAHSD